MRNCKSRKDKPQNGQKSKRQQEQQWSTKQEI